MDESEHFEPPEPPGPERAAQIAQDKAILALPTEPYLGLTLAEAGARAEAEGRELVVTDLSCGRASMRRRRLKIALDVDGKVSEVAAG